VVGTWQTLVINMKDKTLTKIEYFSRPSDYSNVGKLLSLKSKSTRNTYIKENKKLRWTSWLLNGALGILLIVPLTLFVSVHHLWTNWWVVYISVVSFLLGLMFYLFYNYPSEQRVIWSLYGVEQKNTCYIKESGIEIHRDSEVILYDWKNVDYLENTEYYLLIHLKNRRALFFPKSAFGNDGLLSEFINIVNNILSKVSNTAINSTR
jgi:hypothetical protein